MSSSGQLRFLRGLGALHRIIIQLIIVHLITIQLIFLNERSEALEAKVLGMKYTLTIIRSIIAIYHIGQSYPVSCRLDRL